MAWIDDLRGKLEGPLPGRAAQYKMASARRLEELGDAPVPPDDARVACVLHLLHYADGAWRTVLIERTPNPRDRHSGQISFPGGRVEPTDLSLEAVALREAEEEVGVPSEQVELLGRLTELYIPVSNFVVYPFVGLLHGTAGFRPQPGEVEHILRPGMEVFLDHHSRKVTDVAVGQGIKIRDVPYFDVEGRVVWGATAMIMNEFLELL
jgi:8-oxo-dGTP pyrophosphatase MutT (NUDIX family)